MIRYDCNRILICFTFLFLDIWEIEWSELKQEEELGKGQFGVSRLDYRFMAGNDIAL